MALFSGAGPGRRAGGGRPQPRYKPRVRAPRPRVVTRGGITQIVPPGMRTAPLPPDRRPSRTRRSLGHGLGAESGFSFSGWRSRIRQSISAADYLLGRGAAATGFFRYQVDEQGNIVSGPGGRQPIGVPLGFMSERPYGQTEQQQTFEGSQGAGYSAGRAAMETTLDVDEEGRPFYSGISRQAPRYFDGDQFRPAGMSVEQRGQLQKEMVMAGLLTGEFTWGQWDAPTAAAYASLLAYANQGGMTEQEAMRESRRAFDRGEDPTGGIGGGGEGGGFGFGPGQTPPPFVAPVYEAPDPAALSNDVREYVFAKLGRAPSQDELDVLVDSLESGYRARYDQFVVPVARQEYEMEMGLGQLDAQLATPDDPRATIPEWLGGPPAGFGQSDVDVPEQMGGEQITEVDPEAEFFEEFRKRFGDPDRRKAALETSARGQSASEATMARAMSILGGR